MDFFKNFRIQLILLCFSSFSFAQIETGKVRPPEPPKEEKPKVKPPKPPKTANYDPSTVFYLGGSLGYSSRELKSNPTYFGKPLGARADETGTIRGGAALGMRTRIASSLYFDFGVALANYGESYDFSAADTAYSYQTSYSYFAIPVKLLYVTGQKIRFIGGIGLQPQMFLAYKQEIEWTNTSGKDGSQKVRNGNDFNFFTIAALANAGLEWQFAKSASVFLLPEARYQLNSSFGKQAPYVHKGIFLGAQLGLSVGIN